MRWVALVGLATGCLEASSAGDPDAAGSAEDAGASDGAPFDASCSWVDEFEGDDLDERWREDLDVEGGTIDVADGRVVLDATPEEGEYIYIAMHHDRPTPIAGTTLTGRMSAQLVGGSDAMLVWDDGEDWLSVGFHNATMAAWYGDSEGYIGAFCGPCPAYDDDDVSYVRLRADDDQIHFEASRNDSDWDIEIAPPQPIEWEQGRFYLWAEAGQTDRATLAIERFELECGAP
jgi:hypothetical protein